MFHSDSETFPLPFLARAHSEAAKVETDDQRFLRTRISHLVSTGQARATAQRQIGVAAAGALVAERSYRTARQTGQGDGSEEVLPDDEFGAEVT